MHAANDISLQDVSADLPLARIDGQDESYLFTIREYLESNGCRVTVGDRGVGAAAYHLAIGEIDFVKSIFAQDVAEGTRRLAILWRSDRLAAEKLLPQDVKIFLTDPTPLAQEDVSTLFSFFFTSGDRVLDKRRIEHLVNPVSYKPEPQRTRELIPGAASQASKPPGERPLESVTRKQAYEQEEVLSVADERRIGAIVSEVFGKNSGLKKKRGRKPLRKPLWGALIMLLGIIVLPMIWYAVGMTMTGATLSFASKDVVAGRVTEGIRWTRVSSYWVSQGRAAFTVARYSWHMLGLTRFTRTQERLLSFFDDVIAAQDGVLRVAGEGKAMVSGLLTPATGEAEPAAPVASLEKFRITLVSAGDRLGLAQAQLDLLISDGAFPFSMPTVKKRAGEASQLLSTGRETLDQLTRLLMLYPRLAGFDAQKRYLVLLQNSAELRPTGGFIGSVGVVTFAEGQLTDFTVQDVYALDGQLKGHVDPPAPIRELLQQEHWYLRDSNWDPDFSQSGAQAVWFYEKESGQTVDGVIAVSTPFVVDLLNVIGPVELPDYNDRITAENFYGKVIYYTQGNFFPGSTQKKDFLGAMARALLTQITSAGQSHGLGLFAAAGEALKRHDVLFYFTNADGQALVEQSGWAGRVPAASGCGVDPSCFFDPLVVVESNMSVSKVNMFVTRHQDRHIRIQPDGTVSETVALTWRNTASADAQGIGGTYRTYARFILPSESSVAEVTLDGKPIASRNPKETNPAVPYIETTPGVAGGSALGVVVDIEPGVEKRLVVAYDRLVPLAQKAPVLDIFEQKQPGIRDYTYALTVSYPLYFRAQTLGDSAPLVANEGKLTYNTLLNRDQRVRVRFTK